MYICGETLQHEFSRRGITDIGITGDSLGRELLSNLVDILRGPQAKFDSIDGRKGEPECLCSMGSEVDHGSV